MEVSIEQGKQYYFFSTKETLRKCPKCFKTYSRKLKCLKCDTPLVPGTKEHTGKIKLDLSEWSCDCVFGSYHRFGEHWKKNYPGSACKHIRAVLEEIKGEEKDGNRNSDGTAPVQVQKS